MPLSFTPLDWAVVGLYLVALTIAGVWASRRAMKKSDDYFLASHQAPIWLVAISVISTSQSAATFLGVPDNSFRGNLTYLSGVIAALLAAIFVAKVLIPRFYALGVGTVYELLENRFSATARRAAAGMYLAGRLLASGARLYLAAIAVSMIVFLDVQPHQIAVASMILVILGLVFTFIGGLNAVIWSDLVQVALYVGAALLTLVFLLSQIPVGAPDMLHALANPPSGVSKLTIIDTRLDWSAPFALAAVLTGLVLLNIGNSGLDQDTTQRLLACKDARQGADALYVSIWATIPIILIFLSIGLLLHIYYQRPDIMLQGGAELAPTFAGEKITVYMHFILSQIPPGLRGLCAVGVIAAAAVNSGLISMSAVFVNDLYKPLAGRGRAISEQELIRAGRIAMFVIGVALFVVSILCFYWQRSTDMPLLEFALGVMAFAYSGLLGVYATAVFTKRGSTASVLAAFAAGFLTVTAFQPAVIDALGLPSALKGFAFPWQLLFGTAVAALVCVAAPGRREAAHVQH